MLGGGYSYTCTVDTCVGSGHLWFKYLNYIIIFFCGGGGRGGGSEILISGGYEDLVDIFFFWGGGHDKIGQNENILALQNFKYFLGCLIFQIFFCGKR